jgi:hypothetical protein
MYITAKLTAFSDFSRQEVRLCRRQILLRLIAQENHDTGHGQMDRSPLRVSQHDSTCIYVRRRPLVKLLGVLEDGRMIETCSAVK